MRLHHLRSLTLTLALTASLAAGPLEAGAQTLAPPPAGSTASVPSGHGLDDIISGAIEDFSRLPSVETLAILSIGGIGATVGHAFDDSVSQTLAASDKLGAVFHSGETLGGARVQFAGALATYALGRLTDSPKASAVGADLLRAQIVTQTLTAGIKMAVGRQRPDGTQFSFPSGHSSVSFATATVLQRHFGWKVGIPAYAFAGYVAASRVQVERHFLSDVAFGAALGIVAGRTVTIGRGDTRFAVSPAAVPGGAGVSLTLID